MSLPLSLASDRALGSLTRGLAQGLIRCCADEDIHPFPTPLGDIHDIVTLLATRICDRGHMWWGRRDVANILGDVVLPTFCVALAASGVEPERAGQALFCWARLVMENSLSLSWRAGCSQTDGCVAALISRLEGGRAVARELRLLYRLDLVSGVTSLL